MLPKAQITAYWSIGAFAWLDLLNRVMPDMRTLFAEFLFSICFY
jgi:hypothetical protein